MPVSWGSNGAIYDWYDPFSNANDCTGQGDNFISYYSFNENYGDGWDSYKRVGMPGDVAWVWGGQQELNDRGMGVVLGGAIVNIKRDSPSSRYGNIGVRNVAHFVRAANGSGVAYPDPAIKDDWKYRDPDNGVEYTASSFWWRKQKTVSWVIASAYMFAWPSTGEAVVRRSDDLAEISYQNSYWPGDLKDTYLGKSVFPQSGADKAINSGGNLYRELMTNTVWPRLYWNKKGYAGVLPNEVNGIDEPLNHNADGVLNHTKINIMFQSRWNGSGPRASHERTFMSAISVALYVPDVPPTARGWLKPPMGAGWGPGYTYIQLGAVTENSINISSYGTTMPHPDNMLGYAENNGPGRFRIQGSRINGFIDCPAGQSRSSQWNVTGLNPDTVYCFYTYAESNPASYKDKGVSTSPQLCRRTMAKPGNPINLQWSKWDTARVKVQTPYWGNDIAFPTNAPNITQVIDYVFNNSPTDTSNFQTTGRIEGNPGTVLSWTDHSLNQNSEFWIHTRTRNNWGVSEWVHTKFETVDRLYRPGMRNTGSWKSHQAYGGKAHRFTGTWEEMTTRSEFRPDGVTPHVDDPPFERSGDRMHPEDPNKWRNDDLIGDDAVYYPENDFYP